MRHIVLWLAFAPLAFGQLDSNTLTVTASRVVSLPPDQATIFASVTLPPDQNLDSAVALLQGSGITGANLTSVYSQGSTTTSWYFSLPVPIGSLNASLAALAGAEQAAPTAVSYSVQGPQVSAGLRDAQGCSYPALLYDARTQAQKAAAALGVSVGEVVSLSDRSTQVAAANLFVPAAGYSLSAIYDPVTGTPFTGLASLLPARVSPVVPSLAPSCALTVQFRISQSSGQ